MVPDSHRNVLQILVELQSQWLLKHFEEQHFNRKGGNKEKKERKEARKGEKRRKKMSKGIEKSGIVICQSIAQRNRDVSQLTGYPKHSVKTAQSLLQQDLFHALQFAEAILPQISIFDKKKKKKRETKKKKSDSINPGCNKINNLSFIFLAHKLMRKYFIFSTYWIVPCFKYSLSISFSNSCQAFTHVRHDRFALIQKFFQSIAALLYHE